MNEKPQHVLVTGGNVGIGRAVAERFATTGAVVHSLDLSSSEDAVLGIVPVPGDASAEEDVGRAVSLAAASECLDVLVCNAGIACVGGIEEIGPEQFDRVFAVNVRGPYLAVRAALPWLRKSESPVVVVVSSNAGLVGRASDPIYSATKFALQGLVRSLAIGLAPDRIRVNAVCPGPVDTPGMWQGGDPRPELLPEILRNVPLGRAKNRMATAAEIAEAIFFLSSPAAAFITGALVPVDGGKTAGLDE